ncbi:MAG: hypothetical protein ABFS46_13490 [Myxococcota bacterium]
MDKDEGRSVPGSDHRAGHARLARPRGRDENALVVPQQVSYGGILAWGERLALVQIKSTGVRSDLLDLQLAPRVADNTPE